VVVGGGSGGFPVLVAEYIGKLKDAAVDAGIFDCGVVVGDVVVAVLGADGTGAGAIELESGAQVEGEVERACSLYRDGLGGVHIAAVSFDDGLQLVARQKIPLKTDGGDALAHDPAAGTRVYVAVCGTRGAERAASRRWMAGGEGRRVHDGSDRDGRVGKVYRFGGHLHWVAV